MQLQGSNLFHVATTSRLLQSFLTVGMLPGLHVNTCTSSERGWTGLSPEALISIRCYQKQTVILTLLASGGPRLLQEQISFQRLQGWTHHTWDGLIKLSHMKNYTGRHLALKYRHSPNRMQHNGHHGGFVGLLVAESLWQPFQNFFANLFRQELFLPVWFFTSHARCCRLH